MGQSIANVSMTKPLDPKKQAQGQRGTPATSRSSLTPAQTLYQQGLRAFKAKNYGLALDQLQQLEQLPSALATERTKAQIALVQVHQRLGNVEVARDRCQALLNHSNHQVQQWASETLATLPAVTTLAAEDEEAPASDAMPPAAPQESIGLDRTGFVPLDPIIPLPPDPLEPSSVGQTAPQVAPPQPSPRSPAASSPQATNSAANNVVPDRPEPGSASLFHYERLNTDVEDTSTTLPPMAAAMSPKIDQPGVKTVEQRTPGSTSRPSLSEVRPSLLPNRPIGLWLGQLFTAVLVVGLVLIGLHLIGLGLYGIARGLRLPWGIYRPSFLGGFNIILTAFGAVGLTVATPWLMDGWLARGYGQRRLSVRYLQSQHPAVLRLLRQICRYHDWPLPELRLIPDPAPLCLSYGWLPRNTRIVISQGLIDSCSEEELTTLVGYELAHLANWGSPIISMLGLVLLTLYTAYWRLALWGNSIQAVAPRLALGILANGLYGLFWVLRMFSLWLSRLRTTWADRQTTALLQRPDLQQQSLLQFTDQLTAYVRQHLHLHPLHQALDILLPLNPSAALSPGSFIAALGLETVIQDDWHNPYRQWLLGHVSHPPLGDRLYRLGLEAQRRQQWARVCLPQRAKPSAAVQPKALLLQKSPLVGGLAGGALALGLWFLGGVVNRFGWQWLSWLYQDPSLLWGGLWLGLGLGLLLRINSLYPDISPRAPLATPADFFTAAYPLPVYGQPQRIDGKLFGSPGLANWLGQDLYLATQGGILRLSTGSPLMAWYGLRQSPRHPARWIGRQVTVSGWQRRSGGELKLDIAALQSAKGTAFVDSSPLWITLIALSLCLWGLFTIVTGG